MDGFFIHNSRKVTVKNCQFKGESNSKNKIIEEIENEHFGGLSLKEVQEIVKKTHPELFI